mgnify:CR=1 FL=1
MVSAGNQEFPYGFIAYEKRWAMPSAESGSGTNLWYSYNMGPMHYIAISTVWRASTPPPLLGGRYSASDVHSHLLLRQEHLLKEGSPQRAWLDADLRKADANRGQQPWIVVVWLPRACPYSADD